MFKSKKILSFIGARAGSKGLKNKNIIDLAGKPLVGWTIDASLGSKYIDRTIVSTDGEEIARFAKASGADVPFLRPKELADDESLLDGAIQHGVQWLREHEQTVYDYLLLLQPTSPLRTSAHIDAAIEYFFEHVRSDRDMLISVTPAPMKTGWLMHQNAAGYVQFSLDFTRGKHRRQEMPQMYFPNGFIYFGPVGIMERIGSVTEMMIPYVTSKDISVDVDSLDDLKEAEALIQGRRRANQ
ncbi:MAG: acylneuraminate cytidylyltransferase family protein [Candidatus Omnitrophica bacterium]|nr:acylneuraminate cytidylyltransferase family protein [Candidatus Omnitrophota bacterium]